MWLNILLGGKGRVVPHLDLFT